MKLTYMPGDIGVVAYNYMNTAKHAKEDTIVALSSGSALNIAQGKFGRNLTADDARWLAAAGADYGVYVVKANSPYRTLSDVVKTIKSGKTLLLERVVLRVVKTG